jgi:hypothetical protein
VKGEAEEQIKKRRIKRRIKEIEENEKQNRTGGREMYE